MGETVFVGKCTGKKRQKMPEHIDVRVEEMFEGAKYVRYHKGSKKARAYVSFKFKQSDAKFIITYGDNEGTYYIIAPSYLFHGMYGDGPDDEVIFCCKGKGEISNVFFEEILSVLFQQKKEASVKGGSEDSLFEVVSYNHVAGTARIKVKMGVIKPFLKTDGLLSLRIKNKKAYIGVFGGTLLIERRWEVPVDVDKELRCHIEIPDETEKKLLKMKDEDVATITFSRQGNASIEVGGVKYDVKENGFDDHATDWREWNKGGECGVSLEEFKNAVDAIVAIQRLNKWSGPTIQLGWLDGLHVATKLDVPEGEEPVVMNISVVCRKPVHDGTYIMYNSEDIKQLFRVEKIKRDKVISVAYAKDTQLLYMETDDYFYVSTPMGDD